MKYCCHCQTELEWKIPEGDNRHRHVCPNCDHIHYQNPNIVAGTIPIYKDQILLCKRAIEPRRGYWTLPAGFMENGETVEQAALRETMEEANATVEITSLFSMVTVPHISQVHIFFLATLAKPEFQSGPESLEVKLFKPSDIPWQSLAFPTVTQTLERYLAKPTLEQQTLDVEPSPTELFAISPRQALKADN